MKKEIWVFAEVLDAAPAPVHRELLCKSRELAEKLGDVTVCSVVLGHNMQEFVQRVSSMGADKVYVVDHEKLAHYESNNFAVAMENLVRTYKPEMLFIGATALGSELAPTVAAKCKTGLAAHCVDIRVGKDRIDCMVPAFGGRVISEIYIPDTRPIMASVRPGILETCELPEKTAEIIEADASFLDDYVAKEELVSFEPRVSSGKRLEEADIVIGVGRGIMKEEIWNDIQELAEKLNAGIGYTRCFVDTGLVGDETDMIGTSGKSVKPKVFLGFGISGATHFVCGMNKSDLVVSVNKDENCKMFEFSDYGVVADAGKIISAMLEELNS